ncbi:hypothetical protein [Silvimonas amylolytica]|uniref:Uncharacterized protein n=1 Tax=Silvimonas amylolytica TaxID=449663 RepID=A0ABQ2PM93_9NEIS|nr:hypothetical protein [Silvimonas amylolytica]GGP26531.1 hypothetical protein GCM10010971_23500 [Silvimonas amylolytica]
MQVFLIGTNHLSDTHNVMVQQLTGVLQQLQPARVLLEIRPADLANPDAYPGRYAPEMAMLAQGYAAIAHGFDWLGEGDEHAVAAILAEQQSAKLVRTIGWGRSTTCWSGVLYTVQHRVGAISGRQ